MEHFVHEYVDEEKIVERIWIALVAIELEVKVKYI